MSTSSESNTNRFRTKRRSNHNIHVTRFLTLHCAWNILELVGGRQNKALVNRKETAELRSADF